MNWSKLSKVLFESGLIIFSVLLALTLSEWREQARLNEETDRAMQLIRMELSSNLGTLEKWNTNHRMILSNIEQTLEKNDFATSDIDQKALVRAQMPNGLTQSQLNTSAWDAIKQSQVSNALDIDIIFALSNLYTIQSQGISQTLKSILQTLNSRELYKQTGKSETLLLLKGLFQELVSQEDYLI
ncbi:MAG: hypothetical protein AAF431_18330 [Pseudomonadota bacterium]